MEISMSKHIYCRLSRQKINKEIEDLNDTINQLDQRHLYNAQQEVSYTSQGYMKQFLE